MKNQPLNQIGLTQADIAEANDKRMAESIHAVEKAKEEKYQPWKRLPSRRDFVTNVAYTFEKVVERGLGAFMRIDGLQVTMREGVIERGTFLDNFSGYVLKEGSRIILLNVSLDGRTEMYVLIGKDESFTAYRHDPANNLLNEVRTVRDSKWQAIKVATRDAVKRYYMFDQI
tara:strand:+ start:3761 stop:4276 length:516 start_codon:yes stop_codon:yes gene_type:complete